MKTLYFECKMGIAGDMMASALMDLFDDKAAVLQKLNELGIPDVEYTFEEKKTCGISGNHIRVLVDGIEEKSIDAHDEHDHHHEHHDHSHGDEGHSHEHYSLYDIEDIIESLNAPKETKSDIREVYQILAEAESKVHNTPVSEIHFHEVGTKDAIADIAAVCFLIHELDPDKVMVSPINVGSGNVKCAHGILPVPAPATALLLEGIPYYESSTIKAELCTPTGAALIKYFADKCDVMPLMTVEKAGYGMGTKEFSQANCVRAIYGETPDDTDNVYELSFNIDDMTPEEIGFATEKFFEAGALEVYTIPIGMKKNRPGTLISCMCKEDKRENILREIFKHTTTIGVRENICNRYVLGREIIRKETPYGDVRVKRVYGFDVEREKIEYDDLAGIANRTGKSIIELRKEIGEN